MPIFKARAGSPRAALSLLRLSCISNAASIAFAGSKNTAITESPLFSYKVVEAFKSVNMIATAPGNGDIGCEHLFRKQRAEFTHRDDHRCGSRIFISRHAFDHQNDVLVIVVFERERDSRGQLQR